MEQIQGFFPKALRRTLAAVSILAVLLSVSACKKQSGSETVPTENTAPPTVLTVNGATVKPGDRNVEVTVEISGNPGILGMDFDLYYDDTVMTLTNAVSAIDVPDAVYTPPAYYRTPTTFLWEFPDAGWDADGTVLTLSFDILETAATGEYEIKIMYDYGNVFDVGCEPINIKVTNAYITIES